MAISVYKPCFQMYALEHVSSVHNPRFWHHVGSTKAAAVTIYSPAENQSQGLMQKVRQMMIGGIR